MVVVVVLRLRSVGNCWKAPWAGESRSDTGEAVETATGKEKLSE